MATCRDTFHSQKSTKTQGAFLNDHKLISTAKHKQNMAKTRMHTQHKNEHRTFHKNTGGDIPRGIQFGKSHRAQATKLTFLVIPNNSDDKHTAVHPSWHNDTRNNS